MPSTRAGCIVSRFSFPRTPLTIVLVVFSNYKPRLCPCCAKCCQDRVARTATNPQKCMEKCSNKGSVPSDELLLLIRCECYS